MESTFYDNQVIIRTAGTISENQADIVETETFAEVVKRYLKHLRGRKSALLKSVEGLDDDKILKLLKLLAVHKKDDIIKDHPEFKKAFSDCYTLNQFVEELYNFWRHYERYMICYGTEGLKHHNRPYRTFANTIMLLNDHVRGVYRDMQEHITGTHPRIYRQVPAGCQVGVITKDQIVKNPLGAPYDRLEKVQIVRQVLIEPPLILDPAMNKRSGLFEPIGYNLLEKIELDPSEFICIPAKVGDLIIHIYIHLKLIGLGISIANLFDIATGEDLRRKPDAMYIYGVDPESMQGMKCKTVFYDDKERGILIGFVPIGDEFSYFGYVKKMILTLHNTIKMKQGRLPVHGAMVCIRLKDGSAANVVIIGDSGAGKSESLEALRVLSEEHIRDMTLIFDDMGSLELTDKGVKAYGTETGAFVRLDDLSPGFAYGAIDRSIIMSPQKINARALIPVTTIEEVLYGHKVDFFLYANNYEEIDADHPEIEWFSDTDEAFDVFKRGARMAKGTTTEVGLTDSYFANPFGPPQFKEMHEKIAEEFFKSFKKLGVKVGQLRTQLGIKGMETEGPQIASKALFEAIRKR